MANNDAAATYRTVAILFAAAFAVGVVVLALLGRFGLSDSAVGSIMIGATLLAFAVVAVAARTIDTGAFHVAGRTVPPVINGMATAAAFMSGAVLVGLAGIFFADDRTALALVLGWSFGYLMLAVLFAPYVRKSGAYGVADFLAVRYRSSGVRLIAAVIVALSLIAALAAAFAGAAMVASTQLAMAPTTTMTAAAVLVLAATVLGGMQAVTATALVQYVVVALAFLAPAVFVSAESYSLPVPAFTFGRALVEAASLSQSAGPLATPLASRLLPFAPATGFGFFAAIVSLAAGVSALPHLLARSATTGDVEASRWSAGWSLLFVLVIALTAPAYAAFARLAVLRDVAGQTVDALPAWIFSLGSAGLVKVCGAAATSVQAVSATCGGGPVGADRIAIGGDAVVLAWPQIVGLPYVVGVLVPLAALAAALATASAIALAIGTTLGHDIYARLLAVRGSAGRHLAVTRLVVAGVVVLGAWLALMRPQDAFGLALAAISLSAGGLFPALFAAVWWRRATAAGAIAGMLAGFLATAAVVIACRYPDWLPLGRFDPRSFDLSELSAAVVGMPVGFLALVAISLLTAAPSEERQNVLDAIRRPGGRPFVHEGEG